MDAVRRASRAGVRHPGGPAADRLRHRRAADAPGAGARSSRATSARCGWPPAAGCGARASSGSCPAQDDRPETTEVVVLARLATTRRSPSGRLPLAAQLVPAPQARHRPDAGPRPAGRVLLCQLTYKQDWDLPGGVVEVGESPQLAVGREVEEELGLTIRAGGWCYRLAAAVGRLGRRVVPGLRRRRARPRDPGPDGRAAARDPDAPVLHGRGGARALRRLHRPPGQGGARQRGGGARRTPSPGDRSDRGRDAPDVLPSAAGKIGAATLLEQT